MPNHIENRLIIAGEPERVEEVLTFLEGENGEMDFDNITPMPRWIYGSQPECQGISREDVEKYGKENTSIDWAIKHWGTKWNAYDMIRSENKVLFQTAWVGVPELMQKVAWIFPDVTLTYDYTDSDNPGATVNGTFVFKDMTIMKQIHHGGQSREAYDQYVDLVCHGKLPDFLQYDPETETYSWVDEED